MSLDYHTAKIYKITCVEEPTLVYYGSTCDRLSNRLAKHRSHYRMFLNGNGNNVTSYQIVKYTSAQIILVENFPCKSKDELHARECYWIDNNICVNKQRPGATSCGIKQYNAEYRKENAAKLATKSKKFYAEHKDKINTFQNQNFDCVCGAHYTRRNKSTHYKSAKHARKLAEKAILDEIASIMNIMLIDVA